MSVVLKYQNDRQRQINSNCFELLNEKYILTLTPLSGTEISISTFSCHYLVFSYYSSTFFYVWYASADIVVIIIFVFHFQLFIVIIIVCFVLNSVQLLFCYFIVFPQFHWKTKNEYKNK